MADETQQQIEEKAVKCKVGAALKILELGWLEQSVSGFKNRFLYDPLGIKQAEYRRKLAASMTEFEACDSPSASQPTGNRKSGER